MPADERVARSVALEQAYVHDVYEQYYDNPKSKPWPKVQQFLEELEPGSIVCDVGCGNGKYLNTNTSIFNIGGEKSTRLSEVAQEKENEVINLDNLALPFRDESLDAVLSIAVVHHLATTERRICALRELARVLRIGGRLIISVWAMEQSHRKFESQDVLVPWHRPRHLSTPSLELTSTTNTSEDDGMHPYHAYTQSDSDSRSSNRSKHIVRKKGRSRKGRSIDPGRNSSPSSSSLSSPNETCYSFVRRAIQKLAGGRRVGVHRPWFLDSWSTCAKEPQKRFDPDGCQCYDCIENIQDLPIELRRIDDEEIPQQRRQTFPSSQLINDIANNLKSKSMTNFNTTENNNTVTEQSNNEKFEKIGEECSSSSKTNTLSKPKLVKQKKSICEDDADEALDQPTDMNKVNNLPDFKVLNMRYQRGNVLKQRSLNEELMSTERLKEKERVRQNIQKQASLNEELIYQQSRTFDSIKDSFFSVSTSKFQLIKTGFTNKIKNSNIDKVTGSSLKNGFVRIFQNWKSSELISPTITEDEALIKKIVPIVEEKKENVTERRHSKEDGSDSSKDSSLQSDTSVDSEDSFASVIFVPKSNPMSPTNLSPGPTSPRLKNNSVSNSVPNSPRIKQSSCPTSPRIKQMPLTLYPLTKQLSSPKPSTDLIHSDKSERDHLTDSTTNETKTLAQKYSVQQIPQFRRTSLNSVGNNNSNSINSSAAQISPEKSPVEKAETRNERLKKIRELLTQKPGFGVRSTSVSISSSSSSKRQNFPIVRHSSVNNGKVEAVAKPHPKLLSLELFNPETDDKDSDSSCVSSPDSVDSVISVNNNNAEKTRFKFPPRKANLLTAAANVAQSLDHAVDKVISSNPKVKQRIETEEVLSVIQQCYTNSDTTPLLLDNNEDESSNWNEECHKYLTDFADKLSEKLLMEIDQYHENSKTLSLMASSSMENLQDPYIHRLSEELHDLSKLSAEIQKQNEYLAKLSASDSLFSNTVSLLHCKKCKGTCKCIRTKKSNNVNELKNAIGRQEIVSGTNTSDNSIIKKSQTNDSLRNLDSEKCDKLLDNCSGASFIDAERSSSSSSNQLKISIKTGASTDSCDSEKGSSTNSMISSLAASINFTQSMESDGYLDSKDTASINSITSNYSNNSSINSSRCSDGGSTASLASCPEWKTVKKSDNLSKANSSISLETTSSNTSKRREKTIVSDTSQDSLPSDNIGGEITYHRYYHVFREGELDQLIEKYVENLHIISSYYDHASWCIIAEKVQVWTI